ncbi:DNA ligase [Skeletonema marinoi]|uniref:DNA ligase n=1 Tax=Skeletonema marinoi TaxID=267567 RepID=A0AAD8XSK4_9STRA|nr:DNA ligase [Skeletonema marinoi]
MPTAISFFPVGSSVTLQNLVNAAHYNGLCGTVQSGADPQSSRQEVAIDVDGEKKVLAIKPANLRPFNDDVLSMSIKELLSELADYNISTDTMKDKRSLQEAVIAARKDGWRRPTKRKSVLKTPPPPPAAAASAAASSAASDECDIGKFSSGNNSGKKRTASDASDSKPSKKAKVNASDTHQGSLPELALAKKWDESMNVKGYYLSEKLDGMRCLWDGLGNLYSRNHNIIHAPSYFTQALPTGIALDGELFVGRGEFQECMSIVKQTKPDEQDWRRVTFFCFDAPSIAGGFDTRLQAVKDALAANTDTSIARVLPQIECRGKDHLLEEFARVRNQNGEGIVLRKVNVPYRGKRTSDLLKYKEFMDAEATVVGYQDGKGKHSGRMGALICQMLDTVRAEFKVGSGFSDDEREWENTPSIGSTITYRYYELTNDGKPRHPVFVRVRPNE